MDEIEQCNHEKVGKALYVKFTINQLTTMGLDKYFDLYDGQVLSVEELNNTPAILTSVPIFVDNSTQGRYECVCEFGTEVYQ